MHCILPYSDLHSYFRLHINSLETWDGLYTHPLIGREIGVQETTEEIKFIYKGQELVSYKNTKDNFKLVTDLFSGASTMVYIDMSTSNQMTCHIEPNVYTWYVSNPFVEGTICQYDIFNPLNVNFTLFKLDINDFTKYVFGKNTSLPFLVFIYKDLKLVYINKKG